MKCGISNEFYSIKRKCLCLDKSDIGYKIHAKVYSGEKDDIPDNINKGEYNEFFMLYERMIKFVRKYEL